METFSQCHSRSSFSSAGGIAWLMILDGALRGRHTRKGSFYHARKRISRSRSIRYILAILARAAGTRSKNSISDCWKGAWVDSYPRRNSLWCKYRDPSRGFARRNCGILVAELIRRVNVMKRKREMEGGRGERERGNPLYINTLCVKLILIRFSRGSWDFLFVIIFVIIFISKRCFILIILSLVSCVKKKTFK